MDGISAAAAETTTEVVAAGPTTATDVAVVIVNYKTPGMVVDCLRSLTSDIIQTAGAPKRAPPTIRVFVADNASGDGSAAHIQDAITTNGWQAWAHVVPLPKNGGFGYGNNAIMRQVLVWTLPPRYIWLLNSDTIVRPGAGQALVDYLDQHPSVSMVGSRLEFPDGTAQCSAFRFQSIPGEFESAAATGPISWLLRRWRVPQPIPAVPKPCDWIAGASMLIRSDLLRTIGLFDERYFLYFEECDLCLRAARAGAACHYVPASRVVHLVGASTGVTSANPQAKRRAAYWFQSRAYYYTKNYGRAYAVLADIAAISGTFFWQIRCAIQRRASEVPQHYAYDLIRHSSLWRSATARDAQ